MGRKRGLTEYDIKRITVYRNQNISWQEIARRFETQVQTIKRALQQEEESAKNRKNIPNNR